MITQSDVNLLDLAINRVASADEMRRAREVVGKLAEMVEQQQRAEQRSQGQMTFFEWHQTSVFLKSMR